MLSHILLTMASIASLAVTQTIDPGTIPLATRAQWCEQQKTSCPLICLQLPNGTSDTESNKCDAQTLDYSCVCSNGLSPNSSEYSQTIPYFVCTAYNSQCQTNCNGDSTCQAKCVQQHACGAQEPTRYNATTTASATATSTSADPGNVIYTGWGTAGAVAATGSSGSSTGIATRQMMLEMGQVYGLFIVVAGLIGGFAVVL
ncbi:hypothetical protein BGW36DRAFT_402122 [Talaromyces proteolyticus]|uniref:DUF7707 domain-containing protein n=1 Tax=Talaromyces proteolyticus TaxID=1131652 RepID=A0AAD4KEE9_9EURO|nr:uncharacterized protein BGW36DRAFT_402122 [Talaromyces proteolyticus]KAH8689085.1 hypothetical protein BGW36DRAFT_402122 [Talaromyces proteolyticus]